MKNIIQKVLVVLFAVSMISNNADAAGRTTPQKRYQRKKLVAPATPVEEVNKEVSVIDQIVEQSRKIINARGARKNIEGVWRTAKRELNRLMNNKDLDPEKAKLIRSDVDTIVKITFDNQNPAKEAFKRLVATANAINTQANVVEALEEGRLAIERAPEHMKEEVTQQTVQNIQIAEAKAEEASMLNRMVNGVKGALAAPGNYFFGDQRTAAKTAFEATIGALTLYGAYKVGPYAAQAAGSAYGAVRGLFSSPAAPETTTISPSDLIPGEPTQTGVAGERFPIEDVGRLIEESKGDVIKKRQQEAERRAAEIKELQEQTQWTPEKRAASELLAQQDIEKMKRVGQWTKDAVQNFDPVEIVKQMGDEPTYTPDGQLLLTPEQQAVIQQVKDDLIFRASQYQSEPAYEEPGTTTGVRGESFPSITIPSMQSENATAIQKAHDMHLTSQERNSLRQTAAAYGTQAAQYAKEKASALGSYISENRPQLTTQKQKTKSREQIKQEAAEKRRIMQEAAQERLEMGRQAYKESQKRRAAENEQDEIDSALFSGEQ